jgi:hypothetical protein
MQPGKAQGLADYQLPENTDTGSLGVFRLKRFWAGTMLARERGLAAWNGGSDWVANTLLLRGLELGLHETVQYLYKTGPSFEKFEQWVLEKNDGILEPERIGRINTAMTGNVPAGDPALEQAAPVLMAEDLAHWQEHGYVVLHNAVPLESCRAAETGIWEFLGANPDDPDTWYRNLETASIRVPLLRHPAFRENRRSLRVRKAFAQLWGRNDLWMTVDDGGFNPPERPDWQFPGPHLHWDTSLQLPIAFGVSGILYLTGTEAGQGAFRCVPGFHHKIGNWLNSLPPNADPRQQDLELLGPLPIAGKAGDLIIWREELPHGASPNRCSRPRIVQYISASPTVWEYNPNWK